MKDSSDPRVDCLIRIAPNKLPDDIIQQARKYTSKHRPQFRTFGITSTDIDNAWLAGFAFCLEGQVEVKIQQPKLNVEGDWIVRDKEPL